MADTNKSLTEIWDDPKFISAPDDVQKSVLTKLGVSPDRQTKLLERLSTRRAQSIPRPPEAKPLTRPIPKGLQPPTFTERVGERIESNIKQPIPQAAGAVSDVIKNVEEKGVQAPKPLFGQPGTTTGVIGSLANVATIGPRSVYGTVRDMLSDYHRDPANLVGDVFSIYILGKAGGGEMESKPRTSTPTESVPPALVREPLPEPTRAAIDKINRSHAQDLVDYAEKESRRRAEWVRKTYTAKQSEVAAESAANKKQILDRGSHAYADLSRQNIHATHDALRASLDSRWDEFRASTSGSVVSKMQVYEIIERARERLRGAPADLKQFNDLIRETGIKLEGEGENEKMTLPVGETDDMELDTARVHSSAIGDRLAQGDLPGNVYQALKAAKEGIENSVIEPAAEAQGVGEMYRALKRDWSQYMRDWHDMRSIAGGKGSVLARALRVPDVSYLRPLLHGTGADLLRETLGRYREFGAKPGLVSNARELFQKSKAIKAPAPKPLPPPYEPLPVPKLPDLPAAKPATPPAVPPMVRAAGRVGGKLAGGTAGSIVGHPYLGWAAGGEIGQGIVERMWDNRWRKVNQAQPRPPLPPGMELPK